MKFGMNLCLSFQISNLNNWSTLKIYLILNLLFKVKGVIIYGLLQVIAHLYSTQKYLRLLKFRKTLLLIRKLMLSFILTNSCGLVLILSKLSVILIQSLTKIINKLIQQFINSLKFFCLGIFKKTMRVIIALIKKYSNIKMLNLIISNRLIKTRRYGAHL